MFDGVAITDTFVLGWRRSADRLVFAVEASLWPGHPSYETPRQGEWTCYKSANLIFDSVSAVEGLPDMASAPQWIDPGSQPDYGSLQELATIPGGFRIIGDFGVVRVHAASVRLELNATA